MAKKKTSLYPNAGLYGQKHSSRDYTQEYYWGKNQFNSSFPASLVAYMKDKNGKKKDDYWPVYLKTNGLSVIHGKIDPVELLGIDPTCDDAYYTYEASFSPYEIFYNGDREKIDLVMMNYATTQPLSALEVKLTALPDNTTKNETEDKYSCEIVVRPPTICFLACSICRHYNTGEGKNKLRSLLQGVPQINRWEEKSEVAQHYDKIKQCIDNVVEDMESYQTPLVLQPVWKTDGKTMRLKDDCLDAFVWSNTALIQLFSTQNPDTEDGISRFQRATIWLYRMLWDFVTFNQFDYVRIIKLHSYDYANDKAFAISGKKTYQFLKCDELTHPRIKKDEIKKIILGGGQNYLSPERRFDAVLVNSTDVF